MDEIEPALGEVYYSFEFQQYALILDEHAAYYYARDDLIEQRLFERRLAWERRQYELRTMPYRLYLQTPEWAERARRARERALHRCSVCNRDDPLEVHHRTYERRGAEREDDVIALCSTCHGLFHEWRL
ncbi:MAG: HNH endonuclease [Actinomycetota bacterium]|nr:HNH endonuclease [Actinomycetota bacterium]